MDVDNEYLNNLEVEKSVIRKQIEKLQTSPANVSETDGYYDTYYVCKHYNTNNHRCMLDKNKKKCKDLQTQQDIPACYSFIVRKNTCGHQDLVESNIIVKKINDLNERLKYL